MVIKPSSTSQQRGQSKIMSSTIAIATPNKKQNQRGNEIMSSSLSSSSSLRRSQSEILTRSTTTPSSRAKEEKIVALRNSNSNCNRITSTPSFSSTSNNSNNSNSNSSILTNTQTSFTPITAHYNLNQTLHNAFHKVYSASKYKLALSIGLQFCRVALFDIPTHGYYNSPKYYKQKANSAKDAKSVSDILCTFVVKRVVQGEMQKRKGQTQQLQQDNNELEYYQASSCYLPKDLIDQVVEAKLLKEVAKEHFNIILNHDHTRTTTTFATSNNRSTKSSTYNSSKKDSSTGSGSGSSKGGGGVKKQVVTLDEDDRDLPAWLKMLDCGASTSDIMLDLCSTSDNSSKSKSNNSSKNKNTFRCTTKEKNLTTMTMTKSKNNNEGKEEKIDDDEEEYTTIASMETLSISKQKLLNLYHKRELSPSATIAAAASIEKIPSAPADLGSTTFTETMNKKMDAISTTENKKYEHKEHEKQYQADLERALHLSGLEFQNSNTIPTTTTTLNTKNKNVITSTSASAKASTEANTNKNNNRNNTITTAKATPTIDNSNENQKNEKTSNVLDVKHLSQMYKEDFQNLIYNNEIIIHYIDTYQGRIRGSTNGCTVIAPLVALHYLCDEHELSNRSDIFMEGKSRRDQQQQMGLYHQNEYRNYDDNNNNEEKDNDPVCTIQEFLNPPEERQDNDEEYISSTAATTPKKKKREKKKRSSKKRKGKEFESHAVKEIDNDTIKAIIDIQTPIVLPKVREKLGLHVDALIIPSDVHENLITWNMLQQSQFVDICTGNILNDFHLGEFIETLAARGGVEGTGGNTKKEKMTTKATEKSHEKKLAATFFFHAHVISILRITKPKCTVATNTAKQMDEEKGKKLKRRSLFSRNRGDRSSSRGRGNAQSKQKKNVQQESISYESKHENHNNDDEIWFEIIDSLPGHSMLGSGVISTKTKTITQMISSSIWLDKSARIKCKNEKSLHAALRWYGCSKFTFDDKKYIDTYQWNHMNMDFDPRVFQAFIWSE
jgi:hypothetical protein